MHRLSRNLTTLLSVGVLLSFAAGLAGGCGSGSPSPVPPPPPGVLTEAPVLGEPPRTLVPLAMTLTPETTAGEPSPPPLPTPTTATGPVVAPGLTPPGPTVAPDTPPEEDVQPEILDELGPGWVIDANYDINFDGRIETVAYKPSDITPEDPFPPGDGERQVIAAEFVIVREALDGSIQYVLKITPQEATGRGEVLTSLTYPDSQEFNTPVAFVVTYTEGSAMIVFVNPLNNRGASYTNGPTFRWNGEMLRFEVATPWMVEP